MGRWEPVKPPTGVELSRRPAAFGVLARRLTDRGRPPVGLGANLVLLALWLWLYRPVYPYLATIFTRQEFRTNQLVLVGALALLALQARRGELRLRLDKPPQLCLPALSLALAGSALFVLVERFLDINTLSASLFGLASYGLLGLWMRPRRWRQGLTAALLLVGALPFGEHMQTFIGYPVRLLTAAIVRDGLSTLGVPSIGIDTILVFENGVSQVDLPCSGVKSLWAGALFLLAATWIERRPLNLRWLAVGLSFSLLLLAANLARVGVLVTVGVVADWRLLAEMLHVPLGVLGFVGACAAAVAMLRWAGTLEPGHDPEESQAGGVREALPRPAWLTPLLAGTALALSLLYAPRASEAAVQALPRTWGFPPDLQVEAWPLSASELEWLSSDGALSGDRWRFTWRGQTGSLLFVTSASWRAHHRPERCFQVYGLTVENAQMALVDPAFPVRLLVLGDGAGQGLYSAVYWFQSANQVTDDYATRIWADLEPERKPWVLVTILMDGPYDPLAPELETLYPALRQTVARSLVGEERP